MNFSDQSNPTYDSSTERRRATAHRDAVQDLANNVANIAPEPSRRQRTGRVTRSQSTTNTNLETRLQSCMYFSYFIINANFRKRIFHAHPSNPPSREDLDVSYNHCAKLKLSQRDISQVVRHCLTSFPNIPDIQLCFALTNRILDLMGWKFVCRECGMRFPKNIRLQSHNEARHEQHSQFKKCSFRQCGQTFKSVQDLVLHHQQVHRGGPIWQENCIIFKLLLNESGRVEAALRSSSGAGSRNQRGNGASLPGGSTSNRRGAHSRSSSMSINASPTPSQILSSIITFQTPPPSTRSGHSASSIPSLNLSGSPPLAGDMPQLFQLLSENHSFNAGPNLDLSESPPLGVDLDDLRKYLN